MKNQNTHHFTQRNGHLDVSKNSGTPKSSILIGFSIINHPFWSTPIVGNTLLEPEETQLVLQAVCCNHLDITTKGPQGERMRFGE